MKKMAELLLTAEFAKDDKGKNMYFFLFQSFITCLHMGPHIFHDFSLSLEWMKAYKGCLELVLTYELKLRYNNTAPYRRGEDLGCIDAANAGDRFKVIVILDEKDNKEDTLEKTCTRGGPEECDEDCQQWFPDYLAPSAAPSAFSP